MTIHQNEILLMLYFIHNILCMILQCLNNNRSFYNIAPAYPFYKYDNGAYFVS